jgi:hypothetical protein
MVPKPPTPRPVGTLADALWAEFAAIHGGDRPVLADHSPEASLLEYCKKANHAGQTALCLSGGGIRSASFSLGVLQALARKKLLTEFHYLSTVSGGGYIGGWLTALINAHDGDVNLVQDKLGGCAEVKWPGQQNRLPELTALRKFTDFLTPRPGLASTDTWAGILLWVRNVLINWMLFLPAFLAMALVPLLYRDLIIGSRPGWGIALLLAGFACLGAGVYFAASLLPSHSRPQPGKLSQPTKSRSAAEEQSRKVQRRVVLPILAWAFLVPLIAAPSLHLALPAGAISLSFLPWGCFFVMNAAYAVAWWRAVEGAKIFRQNLAAWVIGAALASIILNVGLDLGLGQPAELLAIAGPVWVTLAHLAQSLFYVALRKEGLRSDLDREWLARLNALKVVPALLWGVFAAICLVLPERLLGQSLAQYHAWWVAITGIISGPAGAWLGKSTLSSGASGNDTAKGWRGSITLLATLAGAVFATMLFTVLAKAAYVVTGALAPATNGELPGYRWAVDAALVLIFASIAHWFGKIINVNRFSMHAVYRNRLVRAFLGTARTARTPDGFTGIDPNDNIRMSKSFTPRAKRALFHVVNVTLNLTKVRDTAWSERLAASFTITPTACGSAVLHRREDRVAGKKTRGAYVETKSYAGAERETGQDDYGQGILLGTAVTLSGAAVSPNMGYHSMAGLAFLMTLFNVRLGAWLPNPAMSNAEELQQAQPPNALLTLARELTGFSDDRGRSIYLSDGGHFDNLGLYEMLRRRCRFILAVDAGEDPDVKLADLGNALRKAFIDFGIEVTFDPPLSIGSRANPLKPVHGYACAHILYPEGATGELIYIRPCDLPDATADVLAYRNASTAFPHETTLNQWYSESQFESYRALGYQETTALGATGQQSLEAFFRTVKLQARQLMPNETQPITRPRSEAMAYDVPELLSMSQAELDGLFTGASPGPIPEGEANGTAIIAPGTVFSKEIAAFITFFAWQGKVFDPKTNTLRNRIGPFGLNAIVAKVYVGESWLDQKPCIILDYSETSIVAEWIRDEIRLIGDKLYLGVVYAGKTRLINFALQF